MADKWEQFAAPSASADKWEQYAQTPGIAPHNPSVGEIMTDQAGRAIKTAASDLNPMPLVKAVMHPLDTARGMFNATSEAVGRTREALGKGQYGEAAKSAVGAVPVLGPQLESFTRDATEGRIPEAVGHAGALYLGGKVPGAVGKLARAGAEPLAESALSIRPINRAYGRTPGAAALDETTGVRPDTVAASARSKLGQITPELEAKAAASTAPTNLQPSLDLIRNQAMKLKGQNQRLAVQQLGPMEEHLTKSVATGMPLSRMQSARGLLELKRGFGDEFIHNWNPEMMTGTRGTAARVYHELGNEFERAVPEAAPLNQRISSLIPVAERAESIDRNAGLGQRTMQRVAAHTGALTGAAGGYYAAGIPGAILGAIVPELLAEPTVQMIGARTLDTAGKGLRTPAAAKIGRALPLIQEKDQ